MFLLPSTVEGFIPCLAEDILREIDAALERLGLSARAASMRAQGAPEMIRDMRRGHVPSVQRLRSLCEVLDLEFYVGPSQERRDDTEALLDLLWNTLERMAEDLPLHMAETDDNPVSDDPRSAFTVRRIPALALAESESGSAYSRSRDLAPDKAAEGDVEKPPPQARRAGVWLNGGSLLMRGLDPANCQLVRIRDEYMEPTLPNGCMVLVDRASTDWQPPRIMAVRMEDDVIARRAALGDDGQRMLASNHPGWPIAPLPAGAEVVGEVRWAGIWLNRATSAGDQPEAVPARTPSQD